MTSFKKKMKKKRKKTDFQNGKKNGQFIADLPKY